MTEVRRQTEISKFGWLPDHITLHTPFTAVGEFSVNLETQEVIVKSTQPYEDIHAKIKKTGKEVSIVLFDILYRCSC